MLSMPLIVRMGLEPGASLIVCEYCKKFSHVQRVRKEMGSMGTRLG